MIEQANVVNKNKRKRNLTASRTVEPPADPHPIRGDLGTSKCKFLAFPAFPGKSEKCLWCTIIGQPVYYGVFWVNRCTMGRGGRFGVLSPKPAVWCTTRARFRLFGVLSRNRRCGVLWPFLGALVYYPPQQTRWPVASHDRLPSCNMSTCYYADARAQFAYTRIIRNNQEYSTWSIVCI